MKSFITDNIKDIDKDKPIIYIAGSTTEYSKEHPRANDLSKLLGYRLISRDYRIITSNYNGIGEYIIDGAIRAAYQLNINIYDCLSVIPFIKPVSKIHELYVKEILTKYKYDMLSKSDIAIFLYGTKLNDNNLSVVSEEVLQEHRIAAAVGIPTITLDFTGGATKVISDSNLFNNRKITKFTSYNKLMEELNSKIKEALGNTYYVSFH